MIDPTARVDSNAQVAATADIGAWSVVGPGVEIGPGTRIGAHAVLRGPTVIGRDNNIYQFCSIGDDPQDKKFSGESESRLIIGDRNTIREYCTLNRGTVLGGGETRVGDDNWIMAYSHIAHDCIVGSHTVFANNASLAGHVLVEDYATLGGFTLVHQFCRIGRHSFTAMGSVVLKDLPPFVVVTGNAAKPRGLNRDSLLRRGFTEAQLRRLRRAYKVVYKEGLTIKEAIRKLESMSRDCDEVAHMAAFLASTTRGIVR
jgi:UDP-N-acetylglucosamine acyltransferase